MAKSIEFHKYTALGNSFTVIDELDGITVDEQNKFHFAQEYADFDFGIGSNGIIFIQRPGYESFNSIRQTYGAKWLNQSVFHSMEDILARNIYKADAIMRIIEPDGHESAMCGNGIRCVADYLHRKLKRKEFKILTEINTLLPQAKQTRQGDLPGTYRVCMGLNSKLPKQFRGIRYEEVAKSYSNCTDYIDIRPPFHFCGKPPCKLRIEQNDLSCTCQLCASQNAKSRQKLRAARYAELAKYHSDDSSRIEFIPPFHFCGKPPCNIRGYVTYSSEPHVVFFVANTESVKWKLGLTQNHLSDFFHGEEAYRSATLNLLGDFLNDRLSDSHEQLQFFDSQEGANIDVAAVELNGSQLEMRVYERGSWNITKACGTGACAIVATAYELGLLNTARAEVLCEGSVFSVKGSSNATPYFRQNGGLIIEKDEDGWWMEGPVEYIYSGMVKEWQRRIDSRHWLQNYKCEADAADNSWNQTRVEDVNALK